MYDYLVQYASLIYKFTGKERDSESGLDNFGARYNASSLGRFMTPDWSASPAAVPFANPSDPQSLNLYSYVVNNPLNRSDPTGHNWFCTSGSSSNCGHWEWHKGSEYTDKGGNKFTSKYTGAGGPPLTSLALPIPWVPRPFVVFEGRESRTFAQGCSITPQALKTKSSPSLC